ncbi:hypothetical protein [Bradyrhizobium sp. BR 1433]|uniref:hypothetical protein n=1 Tax=Bradyrhizobium sp. BR 1433 TaxID=3447967 RepID=UPI003EE52F57
MVVAISELFDFLDRSRTQSIERYEMASPDFGVLRRNLRQIIVSLRESGDPQGVDISDGLRTLLSEWLTVPAKFDETTLEAMSDLMGQREAVRKRWGADVGALFDDGLRAMENLASTGNPVRTQVADIIRSLRATGVDFKIYCHVRARQHFNSLFDDGSGAPLADGLFVHSIRDYRELAPFDALLKVGPLRAYGWGSAPDALINAPRFARLEQVVWSGSRDEPDFGYDPVLVGYNSDHRPTDAIAKTGSKFNWVSRTTHYGEDPDAVHQNIPDELELFRQIIKGGEARAATLIQIDDDHVIFYPQYAQVLSFDPDPNAHQPIGSRIPGHTLTEGMFLIKPSISNVNFGGLHADGRYSNLWKPRLESEIASDMFDLVRRLKESGIALVSLRSLVHHWSRPPSTVIHAPQEKKHFKLLLEVLGLGDEAVLAPNGTVLPLWQLAWEEIRRSRGEAIQTGFLEREILDEELTGMLIRLLPDIRGKLQTTAGFRVNVPASSGMSGDFLFLRVCSMEKGFKVPEAKLKLVQDIGMADRWRE